MNQELERYILRCDSLEIQKFLHELTSRELVILYHEAGVYARRKIEGNISKRMHAFLKEAENKQISAKEVQSFETKALEYFKSGDFTEYHNIKVKESLAVMRTMRKKKFHEKYISTFSRAKYEDKSNVENVDRSWYKIYLLEEKFGFPKDTIIPYLENGKVMLCVLVNGKEYVIGELICYSAFENMLPDYELSQLAALVKEETKYIKEQEGLTQKQEEKPWQLVFQKAHEALKRAGQGNDIMKIYETMNKIGKEMIEKNMMPEGSAINFTFHNGTYLQFIFHKDGTLVDVVDPYKYERNFVIDENAAQENDFRVLRLCSMYAQNLMIYSPKYMY